MNPKKNKNKNRRKSRTPKKRVTRLHPLGDTETENDSQPEEPEEVPESAESEGEEEPQSDPILPDGEWFMPDLCSTTLTEVIRKGTP